MCLLTNLLRAPCRISLFNRKLSGFHNDNVPYASWTTPSIETVQPMTWRISMTGPSLQNDELASAWLADNLTVTSAIRCRPQVQGGKAELYIM
jgi:hypothetical protein